ncbi:MAG: hypothetical protein L3J39_18435, partial [Verrucomicrobiales bacterium]|nr:hypothetical protein [Verrucomicrobiales bacterium]
MKLLVRVLDFLLVFGLAGFACLAWLWWTMMPQGFPVHHARFWTNSLLPLFAFAVCAIGIFSITQQRRAILKYLIFFILSTTTSTWLTTCFTFPLSSQGDFLLAIAATAVIATLLCAAAILTMLHIPIKKTILAISLITGLSLGFLLPLSQQAATGATTPYSEKPLSKSQRVKAIDGFSMTLSNQIELAPAEGSVTLILPQIRLNILPLLTFESRSPDRFWTIFSPPKARLGPERILKGMVKNDRGLTFYYQDDANSILKLTSAHHNDLIEIETQSFLPNDVYSHLNTFCKIHISTTGALSLAFSPCPQPIAMTAFDYPVGKPARFAYLDSKQVFHVVEASSGEKGPFHSLQQGPLQRDDSLSIIIYSDATPQCRITLRDWAAQASTQLSPTAGWGLPENSIEFSLYNNKQKNAGVIFLSLASTSTGRGWDSVGHTAGRYRNSIVIETLDTLPIKNHRSHSKSP